jgi:LysR family transcriptional regulator, low CO2-responsive transcriptional regulator
MNDFLDARQLMAFKVLAKTLSFTQAAKQLFLTQSAISHSIKALEDGLGSRLFDRFGRRIYLTEAGERLLVHVEKIFENMAMARESVADANGVKNRCLRIGASTTACQYILPPVLKEFKKINPDCKIIIESNDTPEALKGLSENKINLALTLEPNGINDCTFEPLFSDSLGIVVAPSHPFAGKKDIHPSLINDEMVILYSERSYTFDMIVSHFRKEGAEINNPLVLGSMDAIKELVKVGMGVGVLASWIVKEEIMKGTLVNISMGSSVIRRTWGISYLKWKELNEVERDFCELCIKNCSELERVA